MADTFPAEHPARGAAHLFVPGNADSLVAASAFVRHAPESAWVTLAREHRLPVLLERKMAALASSVWCIGYSGTGNPLLPAALEAHLSDRPVWWLTATSGRLQAVAADVPGVRFHNLPGGSLVPQVLQQRGVEWDEEDRAYERVGHLLGRYSGVTPTPDELARLNLLHAASVQVRNQERAGAHLVRDLADTPVVEWGGLESLQELAQAGEARIRRSRRYLADQEPVHGAGAGPAVWVVPAGQIDRGTHGKALATRAHGRKAPVVLIEEARRGDWTKAWIVLPDADQELWPWLMHALAAFTIDFSYTGRRGAGAIPAGQEEAFVRALWPVITRET